MSERLTYKDLFGRNYVCFGGKDGESECGIERYLTSTFIRGKSIDKLSHYEDMEEQGRLIELPCKIGDTVYVLSTYGSKENWEIFKRKVSKFVYKQYRGKRIEIYFEEGRGYVLDGMFGDTVFLDCKEAEQALRKMKGE